MPAEEARRTNAVVEGLATARMKIGEVVTLIQNIAGQTIPGLERDQREPAGMVLII